MPKILFFMLCTFYVITINDLLNQILGQICEIKIEGLSNFKIIFYKNKNKNIFPAKKCM